MVNGNLKFSICIPNYNGAEFLKQTIESVLNQTYPSYEIIMSDNASTDNSFQIIRSYKSNKIKLIDHRYNIGYSHNLDSVTAPASGDYMLFLGADDMLKPNTLEEFAQLIEKYSNDENGLIICAKSEIIQNDKVVGVKNEKGGTIGRILKRQGKQNVMAENPLVEIYSGKDIFKILMTTNFTTPGPVQSTCYSKKLFDLVNGYHSPTVLFPDASFGHKICFFAKTILYYDKPLSYLRIQDTSFTADINKQKNIKLLTDKYLLCNEFSEIQLKSVDLTRLHLQKAFIEHFCSKQAFHYIYSGRLTKFYYYYVFGFASYPLLMLKVPRTYLIFLLIPFSPAFYISGKIYRRYFKISGS
jgi:glycosyltransferase involved in cell wall biosynthesis